MESLITSASPEGVPAPFWLENHCSGAERIVWPLCKAVPTAVFLAPVGQALPRPQHFFSFSFFLHTDKSSAFVSRVSCSLQFAPKVHSWFSSLWTSYHIYFRWPCFCPTCLQPAPSVEEGQQCSWQWVWLAFFFLLFAHVQSRVVAWADFIFKSSDCVFICPVRSSNASLRCALTTFRLLY